MVSLKGIHHRSIRLAQSPLFLPTLPEIWWRGPYICPLVVAAICYVKNGNGRNQKAIRAYDWPRLNQSKCAMCSISKTNQLSQLRLTGAESLSITKGRRKLYTPAIRKTAVKT